MNTKTLLLLGAVGAVSLSSAMAQSVYSVNAVGYVNKTIPTGYSIIANPLTAPTNTLAALFPSVPANTTLYFYRNNNYVIVAYEEDDNGVLNWSNPSLTVLPGEGFWIRNKSASSFPLTFVGEVSQNPGAGVFLTNSVPSGFSLKSSQVPQAGRIDTVLGYPVAENDRIYLYRNNNYVICTYEQDDNGVLNWSTIPTPDVGEGFWVLSGAAKPWARNFTVN